MSDILMLVTAFVAGVLLGLMYFGGLWWTVRRGLASPRPALWFMSSMMMRMALTLAGFYLVSAGHWQRLVICLLGFVIARIAVSLATGRHVPTSRAPARRADDALES